MKLGYLPQTRDEKISWLIEEIGEVMQPASYLLQALGKVGRFGWRAHDRRTGVDYNNQGAVVTYMENLAAEIPDLLRAINEVLPLLRDAETKQLIDQHPGAGQIA